MTAIQTVKKSRTKRVNPNKPKAATKRVAHKRATYGKRRAKRR